MFRFAGWRKTLPGPVTVLHARTLVREAFLKRAGIDLVLRKIPTSNDTTGFDVSTTGTGEGVTGTFVETVSNRRRRLPRPRYSFGESGCES